MKKEVQKDSGVVKPKLKDGGVDKPKLETPKLEPKVLSGMTTKEEKMFQNSVRSSEFKLK